MVKICYTSSCMQQVSHPETHKVYVNTQIQKASPFVFSPLNSMPRKKLKNKYKQLNTISPISLCQRTTCQTNEWGLQWQEKVNAYVIFLFNLVQCNNNKPHHKPQRHKRSLNPQNTIIGSYWASKRSHVLPQIVQHIISTIKMLHVTNSRKFQPTCILQNCLFQTEPNINTNFYDACKQGYIHLIPQPRLRGSYLHWGNGMLFLCTLQLTVKTGEIHDRQQCQLTYELHQKSTKSQPTST